MVGERETVVVVVVDGWTHLRVKNTREMPKMLGDCSATAAAHSLATTQPDHGPQARPLLFGLGAAGQTGVGPQFQVF